MSIFNIFKKLISKDYNNYERPVVIGYPRTGFTLLISIITEILILKNIKFNKAEEDFRSKINKFDFYFAEKIISFLEENFSKDQIIFNKNFQSLLGGPNWIESKENKYVCIRKYIGIKDEGDLTLIIALPINFLDYHFIPHSHGPYEPWMEKNLKFASIRNPLGTINSACHSINALTSEYLQNFFGHLSVNETNLIREKLAISKLSNMKIFNAMITPMKINFEELLSYKRNFCITKWEDIITKPIETIIKVSTDLGLRINKKESEKIWDKLKFKNLTGKHQHNFRQEGAKVGSELKCVTNHHIEILKNHGFDEICKELKYENLKFIDENNYNDFQKKLSFSISKDKPINEIDDKDLDGFAFQKSNIDFKNFNFKTYGWKKYTKIERTNIDNENFINKFWDYADFEMEKMIKLLI